MARRLLYWGPMRTLLACLVAVTSSTGCLFYFDKDDKDDRCLATPEGAIAAEEFRDPNTGLCQPFGGGSCNDACGPCPGAAEALPDWGSCWSGCEGLEEDTCQLTAGCRAAYTNSLLDDGPPEFRECWAVAQSGPVRGGTCDGLDAYACSQHDDCAAYYDDPRPNEDGLPAFSHCAAETVVGCYGDQECGASAHCSTTDGECLPPPGCAPGSTCPAVCYGRCTAD